MSRFILIFSAFITIISVLLPISAKADVAPHPVLAAVGYHSLHGDLVSKAKHIELENCKDADGSLGLLNVSFSDEVTTCPPGYVATEEVKTSVTKINKAHLVCCQANLHWD